MYSSEDLGHFRQEVSKASSFELCHYKNIYKIVDKQVKFLIVFPSSQMNRAKLALAMLWRGNV